MKFSWAISLLLLFSFMKVFEVFATAGTNPPVKTNKNTMTTEFEDHISNKKDLDVSIEGLRDIGTSAAECSPNFDNFLSTDDSGKVSVGANRLSNVDENSLESEGRKERYSTDNAYFDDFEIDYSRPGAMAHKEDAEKIVNATENQLEKLTEALRQNGIDCTEVKNKPEIKDPYYIEMEKEEVKDTEYDQRFCEYLRNIYSCSNDLVVRCEHPTSEQAVLKPRTNIVYRYHPDGALVLGSSDGCSEWGYTGKIVNYHFDFEVPDIAIVKNFTLNSIFYDDLAIIKLNGKQLWSGPFGGMTKLELRTDKSFPIRWDYAGAVYGVAINEKDVVSIEQNHFRSAGPNMDIRSFLKNGINNLEIILAVGGGGGIEVVLNYTTASCKKWSEEWNDICTLK